LRYDANIVITMSWTEEEIQAVWNKGHIVEGKDSNNFRKDDCGAWMRRTEHGGRNSIYGWEIDHIIPKANGGTDDIDNLRPLQWENNLARENNPEAPCVVTSTGENNTRV